MAATAGLELVARCAGWNGQPFDADSRTHVSHYRGARHDREMRT
jgi:hypothetical protein